MFSISKCAIRIPTRLGLTCLLLGLLACAGGNSNNDIPPIGTTPPSPPSLSAPVNGTVGFPVTASVLGPSSTLVYNWTLSPLTASFKGGGTSTSGTSVTFTSNTIGNVILSCVATAGNVLSSLPATAPVAINAPSNAAGTFVPAGNLLTARWGLAAVNLSSSTILVTGGSSNGTLAGALNSTEIYTVGQVPVPSVPGPNMNTARYYHALVALPSTGGTQFLVTGGGTTTRTLANPNPNTEIYDSGLNAFSVPASAMANDRTYHTATAIVTPTSSVFIAGGLTNAGVQGEHRGALHRQQPALRFGRHDGPGALPHRHLPPRRHDPAGEPHGQRLQLATLRNDL